MLDEEVFPSTDFLQSSAKFIKLKIDVDTPASWSYKAKYKITGYPTIVFANTDGEEITRMVGFRSESTFISTMNQAWKNRSESFAELKIKAEQGNEEAQEKVGLLYLDRQEYELAKKFLKLALKDSLPKDTRREALYEAYIGAEPTIESYENSLKEFSKTPRSIEKRMKLAELYEEKGLKNKQKEQLELATQAIQHFLENPDLIQNEDLTIEGLWSDLGDAFDTLGDKLKSKQAYQHAVEVYRKILSKFKHPEWIRGYNLDYADCLWRAGAVDEADGIYSRLEKKYPENFTFYFYHARMLFRLRQHLDRAQKLTTQALGYSYGDNKLRVVDLLAQIYDSQGQRKKALELIRSTISTTELPDDIGIRTHRYIEKLKKLEKQLSG